jgi:hypothetical protein
LGVGRKADGPCSVNKIVVAKSKELKNRSNLAESSKEGYGSKRAVLPVTKMMMMIGAFIF